MTTREKVIQIIDRMSDAEIEAEYARHLGATNQISDEEFEEILTGLAEIRSRHRKPLDAVALDREGRDELAERGL
jgi:hypothetical protein